jgi:hypothetical protein
LFFANDAKSEEGSKVVVATAADVFKKSFDI